MRMKKIITTLLSVMLIVTCMSVNVLAATVTVTINYDKNNDSASGTMVSSQSSGSQWAEAEVKANGFTAPSGKEFNGWNDKSDGTGKSYSVGDIIKNPNKNQNYTLTLYAQWKNKTHTHSFEYSVSGNVITASCKNTNCDLKDGKISLTLTAEGGDYTGDPFTATTDDETVDFTTITGSTLGDIVYKDSNQETISAPEDAGTYTAEVTVTYGDSKEITATKQFTINKINQTIDASDVNVAYNATDAKVTATAEGTISYALDESSATDVVDVNSSTGVLTIHKIGEASIKITAASTNNYNEATKTVKVTVVKAEGSVEAPVGAVSLVYNGQDQKLIDTEATNATGQVSYSLDDDEYTLDINEIIGNNAGEYTVYYKVAESDNYKAVDPQSIKVTIAKADQTITFSEVSPMVAQYGDTGRKVIATAKGINDSTVGVGTITYSIKAGEATGVIEINEISGVVTINGIGNTIVVATAAETTNYNEATNTIGFKVYKRTPIIDETETETTEITYGQKLSDSTISGETTEEIEGTFVWVNPDTQPVVADSEVTTYEYKFVPSDLDHYVESTHSFEHEKVVTTVKVNKVAPTITGAPVGKESLVYKGSNLQLVDVSGLSVEGATMKYALGIKTKDGDIQPELDTFTSDITTITGKNAGNYTVYYYAVGDANHTNALIDNDGNCSYFVATIAPKQFESNPFMLDNSKTYTYCKQAIVPVVKPAIGSGITTNDYEIVFGLGCDHTSADTDIPFTVKLVNNYTGNWDMTFDIEPLELVGQWSNLSFGYDEDAHTPTFTFTNVVSGDEVLATITGGNKTETGEYVATASLDASYSNYKFTSTSAKFYIFDEEPISDEEVTTGIINKASNIEKADVKQITKDKLADILTCKETDEDYDAKNALATASRDNTLHFFVKIEDINNNSEELFNAKDYTKKNSIMFDADLFASVDGKVDTYEIHNTNYYFVNIAITVSKEEASKIIGANKNYYMIREHDGVLSNPILIPEPHENADGTYTFSISSNLFSSFAIYSVNRPAPAPKKKSTYVAPKTGVQ